MNKNYGYLNKCTFLIFTIILLNGYSFSIEAQSLEKQEPIVFGVKDSIYSKVLKEQREIWIHVPQNEGNILFEKSIYPVVYLLDGDAHFYSVTGMIKQLSSVNGNRICPEMIVVGIPNTDRNRDLSPTRMENRRNSGGGEAFTSFLKDELMPYIESKYPTKPYRTLIGHSLGGLMVINTLINHQELFNNYIAIDPSLWWDDQKILKQSIKALENKKFDKKSLYVSIANTMKKGMDTIRIMKDTSRSAEHIRSIFKFKNNALSNSKNKLNFKWKYYEKETHGSVPLISEYDALRFLFPWYEFKGFQEFFNSELTVTASDFINRITKHYDNMSNHFGYTVTPDESLINQFGYSFIGDTANSKTHEISYAFFKLNIKNYPKSANVYDSMGDYYKTQSDTIKAIQMFEKAYAIGKSRFTKSKLEKLKAKKTN
ncbi:alpha/beta hydrolase [Aquimarina algiphila]|uniref:alpha/beta hydrolase n=1 Tax=Aquimarina algiphila TaxID=2047982 RepID=UPI00232BFCEE|nr:alpha/beta hydrolase-fold protein [Aquimarina algiphila]